MKLPPDAPADIVEVGLYQTLKEARDCGLVVSAMELPHWIVQHENLYALLVEPAAAHSVKTALTEFAKEQSVVVETGVYEKHVIPIPALGFLLLVMFAFWLFQNTGSAWLTERGIADNQRIQGGEWWRAVTALTLHGDSSHFVSNFCVGAFFFAFTLARFGGGLGSFLILTGGTLGNLMNAWFFHTQPHHSLGASTAVFAAMGILVGTGLMEHFVDRNLQTARRLLIPVGGGLALFAFFSGDGTKENIDVAAHLWGFIAGLVIGAVLFRRARVSKQTQMFAGGITLLFPLLAWMCAVKVG